MSQLVPKKRLGQHWLQDRATLMSICDSAELTSRDTVLEIGPGLGTLTDELQKRAGKVIAIELDERLATQLQETHGAQNVQVITGDILQFDFSSLPPGYKIVANIPYYLTSNLLRLLAETSNPPERAVLLVQKEVAERATAHPGSMSLLAVSVQMYFEATTGVVVPKALFTPAPKVDSQVLLLKRRTMPLFPDLDEKKFFRIVKAGFSQRRKKLRSSLSAGLQLPVAVAERHLHEVGISPSSRPQELSLDDWYRLYQHLAS